MKSGSYIDLPQKLKNSSKGLLNIKNNKDDKFFMWCHIAYLFPEPPVNKNRLSKYINPKNDVDYTGITFPVTINQIDKIIENLNKINFNIFTFEDEKYVLPLYISKNNYDKICDMLLIRKVIDNTIKSHYVLITDLSKLLYNQNKTHKKVCYCRRCLQHFYTTLTDHMIYCKK